MLLDFLGLENHRFLQHGNMAFHSKGFNVHAISSRFKCSAAVCHEMLLFTKSVTPALDTDDWVHG